MEAAPHVADAEAARPPDEPSGLAMRADATRAPEESGTPGMRADIDHFRRAWPLVLEAVKRRQIGLYAVLSEGRPESLDDDTLVIKFPAGYRFQADMVGRGENPQVVTEALREVTDRRLKVVARVAAQERSEPEQREEDARILSKDELLLRLKQEFDASVIDDGPAR